MKLTSSSFGDGQPIPAEFAFCAPDAKTHCTLGASLSHNWPGAICPRAQSPGADLS
jgi:hypothetical protein